MRRKTRLMKVDMLRKKRASEARHKQPFEDIPSAKQAMSDASGGVTKKPGGPPRRDQDEGMMTLRSIAGEAEVNGAENRRASGRERECKYVYIWGFAVFLKK